MQRTPHQKKFPETAPESRQIPRNHPNTVIHAGRITGSLAGTRAMSRETEGLLTYTSVLKGEDAGVLWVHLQVPTGRLAMGPYRDEEHARAAASALERVAQRRWAQKARQTAPKLDFSGPSSDV
jgi:hypothetical protein